VARWRWLAVLLLAGCGPLAQPVQPSGTAPGATTRASVVQATAVPATPPEPATVTPVVSQSIQPPLAPTATPVATPASSTLLSATFQVGHVALSGANALWLTGQRCRQQVQRAPNTSRNAQPPPPPICEGIIDMTNDDGRSWQQDLGRHDVGALQFADAAVGWVLRSQGERWRTGDASSVLLDTTDGGQHWAAVYSTQLHLLQLAFTSTREGWLLGVQCRAPQTPTTCAWHLLVTADGGNTWRDASLPIHGAYFDGGYSVTLSHPTAADGWIAATTAGPGKAALLVTHDGGLTWQTLPNPGVNFKQTIFFRSPIQGWLLAGGEPGAGNQMKEFFGTTDGGVTWTRLAWTGDMSEAGGQGSGGLPLGGYVGTLDFSTAQDGWVASPRGSLLHSSDSGKHWAAAPIDAHSFFTVQFRDAQHGWAVSNEAGQTLWQTSDGGSAWHTVPLPGAGSR